MSYLFTPPLRVQSSNPTREHPLRFKTYHALTVYRTADVGHTSGSWFAVETPPGETLLAAAYTFGNSGTPTVIDDNTGIELSLIAASLVPATSQYVPATCVPI